MAKTTKRPVYINFQPEKAEKKARSKKEVDHLNDYMEVTEADKSKRSKIGKQIAETTRAVDSKKAFANPPVIPSAPKKEPLLQQPHQRYIELGPHKSARPQKCIGKKSPFPCYVDPEKEKAKEKEEHKSLELHSKQEDYLLAPSQKEKQSKKEDYVLAQSVTAVEDPQNISKGKRTSRTTAVEAHQEENVPEHYIKAFADAKTGKITVRGNATNTKTIEQERKKIETASPSSRVQSGITSPSTATSIEKKDLMVSTSKVVTEQKTVGATGTPSTPPPLPSSILAKSTTKSLVPQETVKKPAKCSLKLKLIIGFVLFLVVTIIFVCIIVLVTTGGSGENNEGITTEKT